MMRLRIAFRQLLVFSCGLAVGSLLVGLMRPGTPGEVISYSGAAFMCFFEKYSSTRSVLAPHLNGAQFSKDQIGEYQVVVIGDGRSAGWIKLVRPFELEARSECLTRP